MSVAKLFPQILLGTTLGATALAGVMHSTPEVHQYPSAEDAYALSPVLPVDTPPELPFPFPDDDGSNPFLIQITSQ